MPTQTHTRILNVSRTVILFLLLLAVLLAVVALRFAGIDSDNQADAVARRSWFPQEISGRTFQLQLQPDDITSYTQRVFVLHPERTMVSVPMVGDSPAATDQAASADSVTLAKAIALVSIGTVVGALAQYLAIRLVESRSVERLFP